MLTERLNFASFISYLFGVFAILSTLPFVYSDLNPLNDYILHYEGLNYNPQSVHQQHLRAKRSTEDQLVKLSFKAFGRNFKLRLKRDTSVFTDDLKIEVDNGHQRDPLLTHIYKGQVDGDSSSSVFGSIINGVFSGTVQLKDKKFYIEKSEHYLKGQQTFHSVIYDDDHVLLEPKSRSKRTTDGSCGSENEDIMDWMTKVQQSATGVKSARYDQKLPSWMMPHAGMYSDQGHAIHKRQVDNRRTCTLYLQSDPELWRYMTVDLNYDYNRAEEELAALFALHVKTIDEIYQTTKFSSADPTSSPPAYTGIGFMVRRMRFLTNDTCSNPTNYGYQFCQRNVDVANFLNLNSLANHTDYCLAHMFTYRDFIGGTLGLAWVGSASKASGGICEVYKEYSENGARVWKSLNTGIVTLVNYGSKVPTKVSTLTFAHEVGHNFGSQHDTAECLGDSVNGNYIMFASATSGDKPNNRLFSPCSVHSIYLVLDAVINQRDGKVMCLVDRQSAFCGNKIVEENEQCDCGYAPCVDDLCCNGKYNTDDGQPSGVQSLECKRKPTAACSPSEGPCCTTNCTLVNTFSHQECAISTDCAADSYCNGINATCPRPAPKVDDTLCNTDTQICRQGECTLSVCEVQELSWKQCYLTTIDVGKDDSESLCYLACLNPATNSCIGTAPKLNSKLKSPENSAFLNYLNGNKLAEEGIKLRPGAPCNNYQGYCDVFQRCRSVDSVGPLSRLTKVLFSDQTYVSIRDWIVVHWWAVLLLGLAFIILMALFIYCCAVHTPSSNPNKPPPRKLTLPRRPRSHRPPSAYNDQQGDGQRDRRNRDGQRDRRDRDGQRDRRDNREQRDRQGRSRGNRSNRPSTSQQNPRPLSSAASAPPSAPPTSYPAPPPYSEVIEMSSKAGR